AGDSFAGGVVGFLAKERNIEENTVRKAIVYGTVVASHVVEEFSVDRMRTITKKDIEDRYSLMRELVSFER
ncbi:sugar kinase, partial [Candidatus Altiarchaeota archaeon]